MKPYLIILVTLSFIAFILTIPPALLLLAIFTFGLGYFAVFGIINIVALMALLLPAVLVARFSTVASLVVAAISLCGALYVPGMVLERAKTRHDLLQPTIAASEQVRLRSAEVMVRNASGPSERPCSAECLLLFQNTMLDWIRVHSSQGKPRFYQRTNGVMFEEVNDRFDEGDIVITLYEGGQKRPPEPALAVWEISEMPLGYVITDKRTDEVLARNINVTMAGASYPPFITIDTVFDTGETRYHLSRNQIFENAGDPDRMLADELGSLGILVGYVGDYLTVNTPSRLDEAILKVLDSSVGINSSYEQREAQLFDEFFAQFSRGVNVNQRIPLVARAMLEGPERQTPQLYRLLSVNPELTAEIGQRLALYVGDATFDGMLNRFPRSQHLQILAEVGRISQQQDSSE